MQAETPHTRMRCYAFGQSTAEVCYYPPPADVGPVPAECLKCEGGAISFAEAIFTATLAWVTGGLIGL